MSLRVGRAQQQQTEEVCSVLALSLLLFLGGSEKYIELEVLCVSLSVDRPSPLD